MKRICFAPLFFQQKKTQMMSLVVLVLFLFASCYAVQIAPLEQGRESLLSVQEIVQKIVKPSKSQLPPFPAAGIVECRYFFWTLLIRSYCCSQNYYYFFFFFIFQISPPIFLLATAQPRRPSWTLPRNCPIAPLLVTRCFPFFFWCLVFLASWQ